MKRLFFKSIPCWLKPLLYRMTMTAALVAGTPIAAAGEDSKEHVQSVLNRAEAVLAEASSLGHAWSVTQPLIDEARAALAAGELAIARGHAERALLTAEQAVLQAKQEQDNWADRVPRKQR